MKKKKLIYVLLPACLLLWGYIIWMIVKATNPQTPDVVQAAVNSNPSNSNYLPDTFSLLLDYKDPFLNKPRTTRVSTSKRNTTKPGIKKEKTTTSWPRVVYKGIVKNQRTGKLVGLIEVDGVSNILQVGQSINDLTLVRLSEEKIALTWNGESKEFEKSFD